MANMKKLSSINEEIGNTKASYKYKDDGCKISSTCLDCPLEYCKYDTKNAIKKIRNKDIITLFKEGINIKEISIKYKIGNRQVYRILKET